MKTYRILSILITFTFLFVVSGCGSSGGGDSATPLPSDTTPPITSADPVGGTFSDTQIIVTLSSNETATIYYSTDGNEPSVGGGNTISGNSTIAGIVIPEGNTILKFFAIDLAGNNESVKTETYSIQQPDTTPPTITSTNPLNGATGVDYDAVISATFSEAMLSSSINDTTFTVIDSNSNPISGTVIYNDVTNTASFTSSELLAYEETYTVTIASIVMDLASNTMTSDFTWAFTTKAPLVSFTISGSYSIGTNVNEAADIIVEDFNNDNNMDLAVADLYEDIVQVMLGDGTGLFGARLEYAAGVSPRSITSGYFNGDSNIDIAVSNVLGVFDPPGTVSILLGDGAGAFGSPTAYDVGVRPLGISTGDFNGDDIPDIVTPNWNDNNVSILTGSGSGTFSTAVNYSAGSNPVAVVNGDYNNDAILDIVVANISAGNVSILPGTNTGTFGPPSSFITGGYPRSIATDDLNNDANLDLVVGLESNNVAVLLGNGFGAFGSVIPIAVGQYTNKVFVADLNSDGINDLVVTTNKNGGIGNNSVYVILGYGEGRFGPANAVYTVFSIAIQPPIVALGDFNGDGKPDIAAADPNWNDPFDPRVYILLNTTP